SHSVFTQAKPVSNWLRLRAQTCSDRRKHFHSVDVGVLGGQERRTSGRADADGADAAINSFGLAAHLVKVPAVEHCDLESLQDAVQLLNDSAHVRFLVRIDILAEIRREWIDAH